LIDFSVGRIDFINTAPVYLGIDSGRVLCPGQARSGSPAEMNRLISEKRIEIASISSVAYADLFPDLMILPGLSISSRGPVRSVLLYSRRPLDELTGRVGLSIRSATARALTRIILEDFLPRRPTYIDCDTSGSVPDDLDGLLVIGDDALTQKIDGLFPHVLDLGAFWFEETGLPFVFGLWGVRTAFAREQPEAVESVRTALSRSLEIGLADLNGAARLAAGRLGLPESSCGRYLEQIDYGLGPLHTQSLERFYGMLKERGEIEPHVELRFFRKTGRVEAAATR